jgi:hypothetical protein
MKAFFDLSKKNLCILKFHTLLQPFDIFSPMLLGIVQTFIAALHKPYVPILIEQRNTCQKTATLISYFEYFLRRSIKHFSLFFILERNFVIFQRIKTMT